MPGVLADTHEVLWYVQASPRLSKPARTAMQWAIQHGEGVYVSVISFVEIAYLEEKQRLPAGSFDHVLQLVDQPASGLLVVPFGPTE